MIMNSKVLYTPDLYAGIETWKILVLHRKEVFHTPGRYTGIHNWIKDIEGSTYTRFVCRHTDLTNTSICIEREFSIRQVDMQARKLRNAIYCPKLKVYTRSVCRHTEMRYLNVLVRYDFNIHQVRMQAYRHEMCQIISRWDFNIH